MIPKRLTVVFADTHRTRIAAVHENEYFPYSFRTVHVALTTEQLIQLTPKMLGHDCGHSVHEEVFNCWLEDEKENA